MNTAPGGTWRTTALFASTTAWSPTRDRLLTPFLTRVRERLHVRAQVDSALTDRLTLMLAARAATVRWPPDGGDDLRLRNDQDVRAALEYFPRLADYLHGSPAR